MGLKAAVILGGCGFADGSEIGETVHLLTSLVKYGVQYSCFSQNVEFEAVDHMSGKPSGEKRNAMVEASRLSRGQIKELKELDCANFDILAMPGGFGIAKIFSNIAFSSVPRVIPELEKIILNFYNSKKPIAAICISPVAVSVVLGKVAKPKVTVGTKGDDVIKCGGVHVATESPEQFISDKDNLIYSCGAYMHQDANFYTVSVGIDTMIKAILDDYNRS